MKILILNGFILYKSLSQFQGPREMVLNEAHFKITVVDSSVESLWIRIYLPRQETGSVSGSGRFHMPRELKAMHQNYLADVVVPTQPVCCTY